MKQRVMVSASAVALVALAAGGVAIAARGSGSHTPKTIMVQAPGAAGAAEAKLSADSASGLARPYQNMNFVISGDLPPLDGDRPAWHLAASPSADLATIAALAKTFGVEGDVRVVDGGWQVGDQQGMGPNLFVNSAPGLPWNFSNYSDMKAAYSCASAGGVAPDSDPSSTVPPPPPCEEPTPPAGVPTKDEALAKTNDLLTALGIDASSRSITAYTSEWSADVQVVPNLDGIPTPSLTTSFGFGGEGKLQYANGFLLSPEKADSYPRVGTAKAFESLKAGDGIMGWFGYGGPMARDSLAVGAVGPATTASAVSDSGSGSAMVCATDAPVDAGTTPPDAPASTFPVCPTTSVLECLVPTPPPSGAGDKDVAATYACGPTGCVSSPDITSDPPVSLPLCADTPIDPTTPPEPVTITITGVHETLVPLMGADGSMWLLPGYEFTTADGGTWPVLAIDESFVEQVAPTQPTPETAVVGTAQMNAAAETTAVAPEPAIEPTTSATGG